MYYELSFSKFSFIHCVFILLDYKMIQLAFVIKSLLVVNYIQINGNSYTWGDT